MVIAAPMVAVMFELVWVCIALVDQQAGAGSRR